MKHKSLGLQVLIAFILFRIISVETMNFGNRIDEGRIGIRYSEEISSVKDPSTKTLQIDLLKSI